MHIASSHQSMSVSPLSAGEVAEKLLDVEADVSKPEHPTSFPPPSNAARATEDGPLTPSKDDN